MRHCDDDQFAERIELTLESIQNDRHKGRLSHLPGTHPINLLSLPLDPACSLLTRDLARLLMERLKMQGFTGMFDEDAARENLSKGLGRLVKSIVPEE